MYKVNKDMVFREHTNPSGLWTKEKPITGLTGSAGCNYLI
jgi:hypothetical protein